MAAPLFLAYGIRYGTASEVSLLLNFETVATTLLAWLIFHEQIGYRVWIGKVLIIGASILMIFTGSKEVQLSIPGLSVLAACSCGESTIISPGSWSRFLLPFWLA